MSGQDVGAVLKTFGFEVLTQRGSHMKFRRIAPNGERQTLVVPAHGEIDTGTLRAIVRQASRYIPLEELQPHFYR